MLQKFSIYLSTASLDVDFDVVLDKKCVEFWIYSKKLQGNQ